MNKIDWTKPIEWVASNGSVQNVSLVKCHKGGSYPRSVIVDNGELYCHEDGSICIGNCGYLRNKPDEPASTVDELPLCIETPTLRDQFAMAALQGILAGADRNMEDSELAKQAYWAADAMMEARKKGN